MIFPCIQKYSKCPAVCIVESDKIGFNHIIVFFLQLNSAIDESTKCAFEELYDIRINHLNFEQLVIDISIYQVLTGVILESSLRMYLEFPKLPFNCNLK